MQQYMSTYKVTLETKGPLYIGSGKQLGKKEYIHKRQKKEIVVPNLIKMYQQLKKKNLTGEYEKFLLNPKENISLISIFTFFLIPIRANT